MKKVTIFTLMLMLFASVGFSQIISQYVETNSGTTPKGIEIWNNTAATLDFATNNLVIKKGGNGGAPAAVFTLNSTTLAAGEAIVIGTSDMETVTTGNGSIFHEKAFSFNGDDALEVWYGATKTDVFGTPNSDPGSEWVGNGVSTKNQNIELSSGITTGSTTGWTDPSTRFETVSTTPATLPDGIEGFGIAPTTGGSPTAPAPTFTPAAGNYTTAQDVTITAVDGKNSYDIYYTTDGTTPTDASTAYTAPVNIATTTTLKAITYATGMDASSVTTGVYSFPIEVATIAELRTQATGSQIYVLTGQAILTFQQTYRNQKYIQDATAAILIDDQPGTITTTYDIGDGITGITGTLGDWGGMLQFKPTQDPGVASSTGNTFDPEVITLADFNDNFENYEAELVQVLGVTFTDGGGTFATGSEYEITDGSSTNKATSNFRTSFYDADYIGATVPTAPQDMVCIANSTNAGGFLTSRVSADIVAAPIPPVPVSSKGIIIAGLLIGLVVVVRKGRLF